MLQVARPDHHRLVEERINLSGGKACEWREWSIGDEPLSSPLLKGVPGRIIRVEKLLDGVANDIDTIVVARCNTQRRLFRNEVSQRVQSITISYPGLNRKQ